MSIHEQDTAPVNVGIGDSIIKSKCDINAHGVLFDIKLNWSNDI
jgi:hypothetical protein